MYLIYEKTRKSKGFTYKKLRDTCLVGCKRGEIVKLLRSTLKDGDGETNKEGFRWRINVEEVMRQIGRENEALAINLKPKNKEGNLSLYEVKNVWGFSSCNWTPIMLHLTGLFVDKDPASVDEDLFFKVEEPMPIFSLMYVHGTVRQGEIEGRWTSTGPSTRNGVLLWPEAFHYFQTEAQKILASTGY
ncbi:MAG: hypothetical protein SVK08_14015 [Halobacteriota archaeon]|nr:hypothetical protein [Halobacteriota archaeon]